MPGVKKSEKASKAANKKQGKQSEG